MHAARVESRISGGTNEQEEDVVKGNRVREREKGGWALTAKETF